MLFRQHVKLGPSNSQGQTGGRWFVLAAIGVVAAIIILWRESSSNGKGGLARLQPGLEGGGAVVDQETMAKVLAIEQQQRLSDQTVWAKEIQAEQYEDLIVKLWDDLRASPDCFKVFKNVELESIQLGTRIGETNIEQEISQILFQSPGSALNRSQWAKVLDRFQAEGYKLEQSEWRMRSFHLDPLSNATALVATTLHVSRAEKNERFILQGDISFRWGFVQGGPILKTVDASGLNVFFRRGALPFRKVAEQVIDPDPGSLFIDPLIVYDLNGDGLSEIILACKNLVFWNQGNGAFQRATLSAKKPTAACACVVGDFNSDSYADLLFADGEGLELFPGDGTGKFLSGKEAWRSPEELPNPFVMTIGDVDGDADLDVWLGQYKLPYLAGQMPTPYYDANDGFPSFHLLNDGRGEFTDRTKESGLATKRFRRTYSSSFVDLDNDGDLELLVVSDFAGVDIYLNDGKGQFEDVSGLMMDETHLFGMAHAIADFNLDGALDILAIGMNSYVAERLDQMQLGPEAFKPHQDMRGKMAYGNRLLLSAGKQYLQAPFNDQLARTGWSWGVAAADFDNDGDPDIYIANGHISRRSAKDYETQFWRHDIYAASSATNEALYLYFKMVATQKSGKGQSYGGYYKNCLLLNRSGRGFVNVGYLLGVAMEEDCRNVVAADLDNDGRIDLLVTSMQEWPEPKQALHIFRNVNEQAGNWVGFRLKGGPSGIFPTGAAVRLNRGRGTDVRQLVTGDSYRAQHPNTVHFGLGDATNAGRVEIRWANGSVKRLDFPPINQYTEVDPNPR